MIRRRFLCKIQRNVLFLKYLNAHKDTYDPLQNGCSINVSFFSHTLPAVTVGCLLREEHLSLFFIPSL